MELLDTYFVSGKSIADFKKEAKEITENTQIVSAMGSDVAFFSLCMVDSAYTKMDDIEGKHLYYVLRDETIAAFIEENQPLPGGTISDERIGKDLINELVSSTGIILGIDGNKYVLGKNALKTLSLRSGVGGQSYIDQNNLIRDMFLAKSLFDRNEKINFVYRTKNGVNKVFACFGEKFGLSSQTELADAIEAVINNNKKAKLFYWSIDHKVTNVIITLGSEGKLKYGLQIKTSDVGDSSFVIRNIVFLDENSLVILNEQKTIHSKQSQTGVLDYIHELDWAVQYDYSSFFEKLNNKAFSKDTIEDVLADIFVKMPVPAKWVRKIKETINIETASSFKDVFITLLKSLDIIKTLDYYTKETVSFFLSSII